MRCGTDTRRHWLEPYCDQNRRHHYDMRRCRSEPDSVRLSGHGLPELHRSDVGDDPRALRIHAPGQPVHDRAAGRPVSVLTVGNLPWRYRTTARKCN